VLTHQGARRRRGRIMSHIPGDGRDKTSPRQGST
jgi:hypothetical protein